MILGSGQIYFTPPLSGVYLLSLPNKASCVLSMRGVRVAWDLNILCWCLVLYCGLIAKFRNSFSTMDNLGIFLLAFLLPFPMSCSDWLLLIVLTFIHFIVLTYLATKLPLSEYRTGSKTKSWPCAGCHKGGPPQQGKHHICMFSTSGFPLHNQQFSPCQIWYHAHCIVSGPLFTTQDRKRRNLKYNPDLVLFPFVCECCTVRAFLKSELQDFNSQYHDLLMLERMRMTDMFNRWARATLSNYKSAL